MAAVEAERHRQNCGTIPGRTQEREKFVIICSFDCSCFITFESTLSESHLEQTEPARAELVFALSVLKREILNELIDEYWV